MTNVSASAKLFADNGVSLSDAHFILTVARPRGFKGPHDLVRLRKVSRQIKSNMDAKLKS